MGTTRRAENHTYALEGVEGTVFLTDTPGPLGNRRRPAPSANAKRASWPRAPTCWCFVLDHDLIRTEYEPLAALVRQGKRSIVVLNKTDRFTDADAAAILAKLRERLRGLVAGRRRRRRRRRPAPMPVRVAARRRLDRDGSRGHSSPSSTALRGRIAQILQREGETLRAGNLLLRAHLLESQGPGSACHRTRSNEPTT